MKNAFVTGVITLSAALAGSGAAAVAASVWTLDVPVDATALTAHGYSPIRFGLQVQCHVGPSASPDTEVGYGFARNVSLAAGGVTTVKVIARPNGHAEHGTTQSYTCYAFVGPLGTREVITTDAQPSTGNIALEPTRTKPIVLKLVSVSTIYRPMRR